MSHHVVLPPIMFPRHSTVPTVTPQKTLTLPVSCFEEQDINHTFRCVQCDATPLEALSLFFPPSSFILLLDLPEQP